MNIVGAGNIFLCAAALLTVLALRTIARRQPRRPIEAKATRCSNNADYHDISQYADTNAGRDAERSYQRGN